MAKKWLQEAIDPAHKGYCTPMTKSTCTPRRKALAKRLKPGGDLYKGKKEEGGLLLFANGGNLNRNDELVSSEYGLPEFGFGSWLGDHAGGILKTAGSIITAIPGFGTIAGPVMAGLGGLTDSLVSGAREKKAGEQAVSDTQLALDEQAASEKEQQGLMNLNIKRQNLQDKTVNYGATFEKGGQIGAGFTGQPQIVE